MKTYVMIYDGFAQFEVILSSYFLKTKGEIITVGINYKEIVSGEGFITKPHTTLTEVNVNEVDIFIIPGGDPSILLKNKDLAELLIKLNESNKKIAAICSGVVHLANSGILKNIKYTTSISLEEYSFFNKNNYLNENFVTDTNIITAKANGYVDFALELGSVMGIYEDENDYQETINFFKYFNV